MKLPNKLREQLAIYNKAGFAFSHVEPRKGSHWLVVFEKVGPMVVTTNVGDPRAIKNNLGELRRRTRQWMEEHAASADQLQSDLRLDAAHALSTARAQQRLAMAH